MKRYLYLLLAAAVAFTSCEKISQTETNPDVVWYFSSVEVETTENSATVNAVKPYITIDGVKEEGVDIYLKFWEDGNEEEYIIINEFEEMGDRVIFTINDLAPATHYLGGIVVSGEYGGEISSIFPITTKEHIPVAEYSCECEVETKGLYATANLSHIEYMVDGKEQDIHILKLEYALQDTQEWVGYEFAGNAIKNGTLSQRIPFNEDEYLTENSDYKLRVTLYPTNSDYKPITCDEFEFRTKSAEVTANITTPIVNITDDKLNISIANATVLYDGIDIPNGEVAYEFAYRKSGSSLWEDLSPVELNGEGFSGTYDITLFEEGVTYEIIGRVTVNGTWVFETEVVSITTPQSETPTPPAPPVTGDADTTALAGDWHLTQWRGSEPSFDVYLSITEDGVVTLYQRIDSRLWETFYSTVEIDNGVINGEYTDGVAWAYSYYVAVDGDAMTWTSTTDGDEVSVYTRCTLPDVTNPEIRPTSLSNSPRFL